MTRLDRFIRDLRLAQAIPFVRKGDRLLDAGCLDPTLLERVASRIQHGVGLDPLATPQVSGNIRTVRGALPARLGEESFPDGSFDCITMLAVLEHLPEPEAAARECARLLAPGGRLVLTVPRPQVDWILFVLTRLRLMEGMSLEEHHGYDVRRTGPLFEAAGLRLVKESTFEMGLNCLFVFEKPASAAPHAGSVEAKPAVPASRVALSAGAAA